MSNTQITGPNDSGSVKERAADEAGRVAESAKEAASEVISTTSDQALVIVDDAKAQVRSIVEQVRAEVQSQADTKSADAANRLKGLATEMDALSNGRPQEAEQLTRYLSQAHDKVDGFASRLQDRGAAGLVDDVSRFARRRPGMFLLCSMGAGFVVGRMLRSGVAATHDNGDSQVPPTPRFEGPADAGAIPATTAGTTPYGADTPMPAASAGTAGWEQQDR